MRQRGTKLLATTLTQDELHMMASQLATHIEEKSRLEQEKKERTKDLQVQIMEHNQQARRLAHCVATRSQEREVDVEFDVNPTLHTVTIVRADTGEIVETRRATDDDLQEMLPSIARVARPA